MQRAAAPLLRQRHSVQRQIRQRAEANYGVLRARFGAAGPGRVLLREGGWYAILQLPDELVDEEVAVALLEQEHVVAHPGYFYDFPPGGVFLVLSLLPVSTEFREGVTGIQRLLGGAAGGPVARDATSP